MIENSNVGAILKKFIHEDVAYVILALRLEEKHVAKLNSFLENLDLDEVERHSDGRPKTLQIRVSESIGAAQAVDSE